jgi:hypothetical protein
MHAYEIDMRSAYLSYLLAVPTGTAMRLLNEPDDDRTWFAPCYVRVPATLTGFGPVGYRDTDSLKFPAYGDEGWHQPFHTWLWSEEAHLARSLGYTIYVEAEGWEWEEIDTDNRPYLSALWSLREMARDAEHLHWVKQAGVASIGRQAIPPLSYRVIDDDSPLYDEDDLPLPGTLSHPVTPFWLHPVTDDEEPPRVTHWWAYVLMRCRLGLWERMELERQAGNTVLMSNYDGILLTHPSRGPVRAEPGYGEWRQEKLTRVFIPAARSIESVEKRRRPGVRRDE